MNLNDVRLLFNQTAAGQIGPSVAGQSLIHLQLRFPPIFSHLSMGFDLPFLEDNNFICSA